MSIGIYKITSPIGKIYIGQSIELQNRMRKHRSSAKKGKIKLYDSFREYGADAHKFEIICQCEKIELDDLEKHYIKLYNSFDSEFGFNSRSGGRSGDNLSKDYKEKVRQANIGKKYSDETNSKKGIKGGNSGSFKKGNIVSEKCKQISSKRWSGSGNPKFGQPMDPAHKEKLRLANLLIILTPEQRRLRSENSKKNWERIRQERATMIF